MHAAHDFDAAAGFDESEEHCGPQPPSPAPLSMSSNMSSGHRHRNDENNGAEPVIAGVCATRNGGATTKGGAAMKPPDPSHPKTPAQPERTTTKTTSWEELLDSGALDPEQWLRLCDARRLIRQGNEMIREGKRMVRENQQKEAQVVRELQAERERENADGTRESKAVLSVVDTDDNTDGHSNIKEAKAGSGGDARDAALLEDAFTHQLRLVDPSGGMSPLDMNAFSCISIRHANVHTEAAQTTPSASGIQARGLTTTFEAARDGPKEADAESTTAESLRVQDDEIGTTISFDFGLSPTTPTRSSPSNASEQATAGSAPTLDSNQPSCASHNPSLSRIPMVAPGDIGILTFSPFSELHFSETSRVSWATPSHEEEGEVSTEAPRSSESSQRT